MDSKKVMLLIGALLLAAVSAFMVRSSLSNSGSSVAQAMGNAPDETGPEVLVATRALPVGTIIGQDSFRYQPWPKNLIEKAYFIKGDVDVSTLVGTVVRYAVTAGQPITQGALVKPGDRGFLAAALGPGMRAVTVSVSAQSGVAGFVFPGDRVDLLLAQDVAGGGDGPALKAAETIVRNLRVLATDQRTEKTEDENGKTVVATFSTVTLETTPKISEKIAVAQTMGQMSLSLRSIADNNAELERAIASGEVTLPETDDPKKERQVLLAIANRPVDTNTTFTVGGDVSRFQRRTVPGRSDSGSGGGERPAQIASSGGSSGPVVRIARGNNVTEITVGGK